MMVRKPEYPEKTTDLSQVTDKHFVIWLTSISLLSFIVAVNHTVYKIIFTSLRRIINEMGSTNKCTCLMLISTILKFQNGGRGGQNFLICF
jgi:hypothetical protein